MESIHPGALIDGRKYAMFVPNGFKPAWLPIEGAIFIVSVRELDSKQNSYELLVITDCFIGHVEMYRRTTHIDG